MRPLEGIKILDFTQAHAGSLATMLLADFGAEVIKIERAGVGDLARYWEPLRNGGSGYFAFLNRNKKSIGLNAFSDKGKEIIYKLVGEVDVVCENFKYGSMERMGFDYDTFKKINPRIIYASLNGYGQTGVMKNVIGLDLQLQAMSGIMDRTGFPQGPPTKVGAALGDHISGIYLAMAVNLALIHRKKTGEGQKIDISILDCLCSILEENPVTCSLKGSTGERTGNSYPSLVPYDTFETEDGYITVAVSTDRQWGLFCDALGLDDLKQDTQYETNDLRVANYSESLKEKLQLAFLALPKLELERKLADAGIPCSCVYSVAEAMKNPQLLEREMLVRASDKTVGTLTFPGIAIKLDKSPASVEKSAPEMGGDNRSYLRKLGYSDLEINCLMEEGVLDGGEGGVE